MQMTRAVTQLIPQKGPHRWYISASFINTFGFGLVIPSVALYFTQIVGLSPIKVGIGFTISGLIALAASLPGGQLADRFGPRAVVFVTMALQAASTFAYLLISDFPAFVVISTIEMLATSANQAAIIALSRRVGGEQAVGFRSQVRAVSNLSMALGVAAAGVAIQIGTATAFRSLLVVNGVTFLVAMVFLSRLPRYEPLPQPADGPRWGALSDRPFVAYALLAGVFVIPTMILEMPLPIWIVQRTHAPGFTVSLLILINTLVVVTFQMRVGAKVETVKQAGGAFRRAGLLLLVACAVFAVAASLNTWTGLAALIVGVGVLTFAEMWFSAASFAFEFGLAPEHAQGQYQGVAGLGSGLGMAVAPVLLIGVCVGQGAAGWVCFGAGLAVLGTLAPLVASWGVRSRQPAAAASQ